MLELSRGLLITLEVKQIQRELVLGIDDPHKEEAIRLEAGDRQIDNVLVCELAVTQGHPTCWVGGSQLPRWIHHDYIKLCSLS